MDRDEIIRTLRTAETPADLDRAGASAREWLDEHPDDEEVRTELTQATARVEPRGGQV